MPTYVYECSQCESTFEVEQRIVEDPLTTCRCGSSGTVKRVIQPIAVMFKGSGFHINDYKGSGTTTSAPAKEDAPGLHRKTDLLRCLLNRAIRRLTTSAPLHTRPEHVA